MNSEIIDEHNAAIIADWLFVKHEAIFPGRFLARFSGDIYLEEAKLEWSEALMGASAKQIKSGLAKSRQSKYPPSLEEFARWCGMQSKTNAPAHAEYQALPSPAVDREVISAALGQAAQAVKQSGKRCIYRPGYGHAEHQAALAKAQTEGRDIAEVEAEALAANGWTAEKEAVFAHHAQLLGRQI